MKRALIYYKVFLTWVGGGRFLPLLFIAELQKTCEVTLALCLESDIRKAAEISGIPIDVSKLNVVLVKPKNKFLARIDDILPFFSIWKLKKLAKNADVCISTVNMIDFGKPAHHFVYRLNPFGDNAFIDFATHAPPKKGMDLFKRKARTFLAETILRPMLGIRSTRKIIADQREHIYPTSQYVDGIMRDFYGSFNGTIFYPPTAFEIKNCDVERVPNRVNYIGRISQEKRIERIIAIVEQARKSSGVDFSLFIAGQMADSPYGRMLQRIAKDKPWIQFVGQVLDEAKEKFLLSGFYAIHAERDETFGIAITEYLKAGCIPIVPDEGGTVEIVDEPELTYHTDEEAVKILLRLHQDKAFYEKQLAHCLERAKIFSMQAYMENQHKVLSAILAESDEKNESR